VGNKNTFGGQLTYFGGLCKDGGQQKDVGWLRYFGGLCKEVWGRQRLVGFVKMVGNKKTLGGYEL